MTKILTIEGEIDEGLLTRKETFHEDENEIATAQEWYFEGRLVKRDAQVQLKKWPEGMEALVGALG
jgi:hypothetical protein